MPQIILLSDSIGVPPTPPQNQFYVYLDTDDQLKGINDNGEIFVLGGSGSAIGSGYVVGKEPTAPYNVIQDAIDAANAQFTLDGFPKVVEIRPGTYTEDLTFKEGVMLKGMDDGWATKAGSFQLPNPLVKVLGAIQPPLLNSSSHAHVSNILFEATGGNSVAFLEASTLGSPLVFNVSFFKCVFKAETASPIELMVVSSDSTLGTSTVQVNFDYCLFDGFLADPTAIQFDIRSKDSAGVGNTSEVFLSFRNSKLQSQKFELNYDNGDCTNDIRFESCVLDRVSLTTNTGSGGGNNLVVEDCAVTPSQVGATSERRFIFGTATAAILNSVTIKNSRFVTTDFNSELFTNYSYPSLTVSPKDSLSLENVTIEGNGWFPPDPSSGSDSVPNPVYVRPNTFTIQQALDACYYAYSVDGIQREVLLEPGLYEENGLILAPMVSLRGTAPFDPTSVFTNQAQTSINTLGWASNSDGSSAQPLPNVAIIRNNDPDLSDSLLIAAKLNGLQPSVARSLQVSDILFLTRSTALAAAGVPYHILSEDFPAGALAARLDVNLVNCGFGLMPVVARSYNPFFEITLEADSSVRFSNSAIGLVYSSDATASNATNSEFLLYSKRAAGGTGLLQFKDSLIQGNCGPNFSAALTVESEASTSGTLTISASNSEFHGICTLNDPGNGGLLDFRNCSFKYDNNTEPIIDLQTATAAHATIPIWSLSECSIRQPTLFGATFFPVRIQKSAGGHLSEMVFSATDHPIAKFDTVPTGTLTPAPGNQTILCDTSVGGLWRIDLPDLGNDLVAVNEPMEIFVADIGNNAFTTNIRIFAGGGGLPLYIINTDGGSVTLKHTNEAPNYWVAY